MDQWDSSHDKAPCESIAQLCNFSGRCFSRPEDEARFQHCVFENKTHSAAASFEKNKNEGLLGIKTC